MLSTSLPSALIRVIWADGMEHWQCQRMLDLARISVGLCHRSGDVGGELRFQGKLVSNEAHRLFGWPAPGRKRVLCRGKWVSGPFARDGQGWDGRLRPPLLVVRGPADGVEYGDGVEVVAPVCDLAVLDRDDGDEVVVVGARGADRSTVDCVFEDDD